MLSRRRLLITGSLAAAELAIPRYSQAQPAHRFANLPASFEKMERSNNCRLGVAVLDTGSGERAGHRAEERFPMCSTFKLLLAAAVLQRVDTAREHLDRNIAVPAKPLIFNSPLTEEHAGSEMTVSALCNAILTRSDNTAANLLLATLGGPDGITRFARSIGDDITRLDRTETSLNESRRGDPRDTTSPSAMTANLQTLLLGNVLAPTSRDQLIQWTIANETGKTRLRAKLPANWRAGDKTGSNGETTTNDIAIIWPTHQSPVLISAYLTECPGIEEKRNGIIAEVGQTIFSSLQST